MLTLAGAVTTSAVSSAFKGIGFNRCYSFAKASFSWNAYTPDDKTNVALSRNVKKFYKDIASGRLYSPSVMLLMPYNLFRGMSLAYVLGTEYETEDGIYWTDEKRKKKVYALEVKVSWWKKPIGQMLYWIGKLAASMKSMTVTYRK